MESNEQGARKRALWIWILLLVVALVAWWYFRASPDNGATADRMAYEHLVAPHDQGEILIDLVDDASAADIAALERRYGLKLVPISEHSVDERFYRADIEPSRLYHLLDELEDEPSVEIAEPDATYSLIPSVAQPLGDRTIEWKGFPNDPQYKFQWHMDQIHMPDAWKLADGEGVIVAVLDTGVAYEDYQKFHQVEDLKGLEFVKPYDFVAGNKHANDDHGHGTHVAGTIAQVTHNGVGVSGIARKVTIMPLKVLSGSGSGSVAGIADAIRYAADNGAKVINMSLGGPFPSRALKKAVKYAHDKGVVVVCAAGNDGRNKVGYPAAFPGAFAVSATQFDESVTFYSNYGKNIDIAAPGGNTRVDQNNDGMPDGVLQNTIVVGDPTKSDYFGFMGTSMASPHVAGVAALVVGEGVTSPKAVEKILQSSARGPKSGKLSKDKYGAGIVDAKAAVLAARSDAGGWQLVLGVLLAGGLVMSMRRRGPLGASYGLGTLLGSGGLFFLPYLAGGLSSLPVVEMLTRGLPSWDLAFLGASGHGNALFFSALLPLGLAALFFGVARLRPLIAGLAVGVAAHLMFHAVTGIADVRWVPGTGALDTLWLSANAAVCFALARSALRR